MNKNILWVCIYFLVTRFYHFCKAGKVCLFRVQVEKELWDFPAELGVVLLGHWLLHHLYQLPHGLSHSIAVRFSSTGDFSVDCLDVKVQVEFDHWKGGQLCWCYVFAEGHRAREWSRDCHSSTSEGSEINVIEGGMEVCHEMVFC